MADSVGRLSAFIKPTSYLIGIKSNLPLLRFNRMINTDLDDCFNVTGFADILYYDTLIRALFTPEFLESDFYAHVNPPGNESNNEEP